MCKYFVSLLLIFTINFAQAQTETPRQTMRTYLKAMVKIKNNEGDLKTNFNQAISTFDLKESEPTLRFNIGKRYAEQLIKTIDKIKKVDYESIPEKTDDFYWVFDKRKFADRTIEISLRKNQDKWLFSIETLNSLDEYDELFQNKQVVEGVTKLKTFTDRFKQNLPAVFQNKIFLMYNWQWLALVIITFFAYLMAKLFDFTTAVVLKKYFKVVAENSTEMLLVAIRPLGHVVLFGIIFATIGHLEFSAASISILSRLLIITMSIFAVRFGHKMIELLSFYATQKAEKTETKFDDILIPLLTKTAYVIVYIIGGILIANSLTINVSGIIAGLGIGGLAFAFAAKDSLANFFGSIMLVLDRPFDIGDVIKAGDLEGVIDEVGFRSTRIRTFNDSVITVSNGDLANRAIENLGKRRFRRMVTSLGLEYNTPAEKIEAFCEAVRELIGNHRWTRKDSFHVYFTNFGAFSLDIKLVCYWETQDYARELAEKHRLHIDILRVAKEIGVSFAFPTQTIHLFQEQPVPVENLENEFRAFGREKAKEVAAKPITLKNPRSNKEDKEQFGDNDVI